MKEDELSVALTDSLSSDISDAVSGLVEVGLDSIMEDGLLKDIPFVSTAMALYKIGNSIAERHNVKKLVVFLNSINTNTVDKDEREKHIRAISVDPKKRSEELEYVLVIIDRYLGYEKPDMLAKLYLAYLNGHITWKEFALYAEITDRFIVGDYEMLMSDADNYTTSYDNYDESVFRLAALGLIIESSSTSAFQEHSGNLGISIQSLTRVSKGVKEYKRTSLGNKFISIMKGIEK